MFELEVFTKTVLPEQVIGRQPEHLMDLSRGVTYWVANSYPGTPENPIKWGMVKSGAKVRIPLHMLVVSCNAAAVMGGGLEQGARMIYDFHDRVSSAAVVKMHLVLGDRSMRLEGDNDTTIRVLIGVALSTRK